MGFKIRIDTDDALRSANELNTLADNYARLSEQFLSEMGELADIWEGEDANMFMDRTLQLSEDLQNMCNRFEFLSDIIRHSVSTYLKQMEDNISAIRARFY